MLMATIRQWRGCTAVTDPTPESDQRAIFCFDQALADAGPAADESLRQVLHDYFAWATTTTMARYHDSAADAPECPSIPRWSGTDRNAR
jgi:hypothetical protein